jgi:hypothetical protein
MAEVYQKPYEPCWCRPGSPDLPVTSPHDKNVRCTPRVTSPEKNGPDGPATEGGDANV